MYAGEELLLVGIIESFCCLSCFHAVHPYIEKVLDAKYTSREKGVPSPRRIHYETDETKVQGKG